MFSRSFVCKGKEPCSEKSNLQDVVVRLVTAEESNPERELHSGILIGEERGGRGGGGGTEKGGGGRGRGGREGGGKGGRGRGGGGRGKGGGRVE